MANADRELEAILEDFDKRCPGCFDEGHGGDGCSYCWEHDPPQDAKNKAKAAIKALIKSCEAALLDRIKEGSPKKMGAPAFGSDTESDLTHFRAITIGDRKFVYCPVGNICSWHPKDYDNSWCHWCQKFFQEIGK